MTKHNEPSYDLLQFLGEWNAEIRAIYETLDKEDQAMLFDGYKKFRKESTSTACREFGIRKPKFVYKPEDEVPFYIHRAIGDIRRAVHDAENRIAARSQRRDDSYASQQKAVIDELRRTQDRLNAVEKMYEKLVAYLERLPENLVGRIDHMTDRREAVTIRNVRQAVATEFEKQMKSMAETEPPAAIHRLITKKDQ